MLMEFSGPVDRQVAAAFEHQVAERLVASGHPAYGLGDTWTGPRMLGDVHFVGENVDSVGLAHGDAADEHGPLVHVHTTRVRSDDLDRVFAARSELVPGVYDGQQVPPFMQQDVRLCVDDEARACAGFVVDEGWLVRVETDTDATLYIEARRVDLAQFASQQIILTIDDLAPYIEGRQQFLDRLQ